MKRNSINILGRALLAISLLACNRVEQKVPFSMDKDHLEVDAEGGSFTVSLKSSENWTASSDNPWVTVSPANGPASAECEITVDSTVVSAPRNGLVRFRNTATGENLDITLSQDGYGYNLSPEKNSVSVDNYDRPENRVFDVTVRTNVPFKVTIPQEASKWLSCEVPEFNLDRGSRPRDVKIRFKWGINSVPLSRTTKVLLEATSNDGVATKELEVKQAAAPEIVPGHDGDSTVVLSIARNIGLMQEIVSAEPMRNWDNVQLWEETDPGYTPQKKGRVRRAYFGLFQTTEEIPYEVQYLTEAEELIFFSNVNSFLYELSIGEHICKLKNLKRLTVSAYGITTLPEEMKNLENLEWLDLSCNNFDELPSILTPKNFPKLHALLLNTCQRGYITDLSNTVRKDLGGFKGPFPQRLLEWEKLDTLRLSVNYLEGTMPDMKDYPVRYTEQDCKDMNLPPAMIGTPKVLPNAKYFAFNLNRMHGEIPDWILYHPNLTSWSPYALCYPQEGRASDGTIATFSNIPVNMDYYWEFYKGYKEHEDIYIGD